MKCIKKAAPKIVSGMPIPTLVSVVIALPHVPQAYTCGLLLSTRGILASDGVNVIYAVPHYPDII